MNICSRIAERVGNPLEWPSSQKASLLMNLYFFQQCIYFITLQSILSSDFGHYLNSDMAEFHSNIFKSLMIFTLAIILFIRITQKRYRDSSLYEHIAAQHFAVTHVYYGYTIGLMSMATGVVLAGAPVVGFIFFHRRAVALAFTNALIVLVALSMLTYSGYIPYAPVAQNIAPLDGQLLTFWVVAYSFFAAPHVLAIFGLAYYILQRWRLREEQVQYLSSTDPLTGLMNRRSIMNHLSIEQETSERTGQPFSVVMVDLDHFKQINDTWGHGVGDKVLEQAATVLKNSVRENDLVGRYGGEEFLVILPGLDQEHAKQLAERIRSEIAKIHIDIEPNISHTLTASLGLCCSSMDPRSSSDELIRRADIALYKAKHSGRDQLVVAC